MNRIYKVIYSKARQCSIVVSEFAKSSHKNSRKGASHTGIPALARIIATALAAGALTWGIAPGVSWAEPGNDQSAVVFDDKGSLMSTDSTIDHNHEDGFKITNVSKGMALGHNAYVFNQGGGKADAMLFGSPTYTSGIAIGENAYALEDSIDLGNKIYKGAMGDVSDLSKYDAQTSSGTGRLLIGNNSYSSGTLSTLIGNHSIMTTNYLNGGSSLSAMQNAGAVSIGALNSIESATTENGDSGIANSIVGLANKTNNANGALIYGAGNTITNSFADVATPRSVKSVAEAAQSFRDSVQKNPGGAALAIGGGNTIDGSIRSQVIGVNNKLTGNTYHKDWYLDEQWQYHPTVDGVSSQYNMIDGYNNTAQNVNHAYVIGANNTIQGKNFSDSDKIKDGTLNDAGWEKAQKDDNLIVIGDNHTLANDVSNNIILGTADKTLTTSASNIVMIGHNADAQKEGGVALGADSVAAIDKGQVGYDPANGDHQNDTTGTWKSTAAAVSVGDASKNITRQITNVAAGFNATDAVNVAQLKNVENQVTSNTQNINYLNGRVGELGDRINKVGAGAAALAALHPLDYDPEDKWDFAAGVGNYRNATAAAVGLFYRPNERTMFNLGWTMGDNRNMVNGGFSLKFGKSNKYIKYSKAEMASVIDKQSKEIAELKARDVQNAKDKAEMKADNAEMKAEIEALKKQVEALAAKK